jgi:Flp pilus assembly protein TadB
MIHQFIHIQTQGNQLPGGAPSRVGTGKTLFLLGGAFLALGTLTVLFPQLLVAFIAGMCFFIGGLLLLLGWKIRRATKRMMDSQADPW